VHVRVWDNVVNNILNFECREELNLLTVPFLSKGTEDAVQHILMVLPVSII